MEGLVALPQRLPVGALIRTDRAYRRIGCGHGRPAIGERLRSLLRRSGVNCQQLRYSIPRPPAEPTFRRDREVFHIFFRCGEDEQESLAVHLSAGSSQKPCSGVHTRV